MVSGISREDPDSDRYGVLRSPKPIAPSSFLRSVQKTRLHLKPIFREGNQPRCTVNSFNQLEHMLLLEAFFFFQVLLLDY